MLQPVNTSRTGSTFFDDTEAELLSLAIHCIGASLLIRDTRQPLMTWILLSMAKMADIRKSLATPNPACFN